MADTLEDLIMSERNILAKALQKLDEKRFIQFKTKLSSWDVSKKYKRIPSVLLEDADPQAVADLISHFYGAVYGIKVTQAILDALNEKKVREELLRDSEGGWGHPIDEHTFNLLRMNIRIDPILYYLHHMRLLTDDQYGELTKQPTSRGKVEGLLEIARCWDDAGKDKIWQALECYHSEDIEKMLDDAREKNEVAISWGNLTMLTDKRHRSLYQRKAPRSPAPGSASKNFVDRYEEKLINQITMVDPVLDDLRDQKLLTTKQHKKLSSKLTCREKMSSLCDTVRSWCDLKKDRVYQALKKYSYGIIRHLEEGEKRWFPGKIASYFKNHFVDGNRDALIKQIKNVDPVLCDLRDQQLLTERQFAKLMEKPSHEEKMRSLFDTTHSWSYTNKDKVYDALRRHNYEELRSMEMGFIPGLSPGPDISPPDYLYKYGLPKFHAASVKVTPQQVDPRKSWVSYRKSQYLDSHWPELIRNVQFVDPVLFDLRDEMLLTKEQFKYLFSLSSSMDKMYKLFILARFWDYTEKGRLLDVLGKYNEGVSLTETDRWMFETQSSTSAVPFESDKIQFHSGLSSTSIPRTVYPQSTGTQTRIQVQSSAETQPLLMDPASPGKQTATYASNIVTVSSAGPRPLLTDSASSVKKKVKTPPPQMECRLCGQPPDVGDVLIPAMKGTSYRLELQSAGLFCCLTTGIKFQVTGATVIDYHLESWSDHLTDIMGGKYEIIGPLFKIITEQPGMVSAVYLPHYLCLKGYTGNKSNIKCAHFIDGNMILEKPARVEPFYVLLENPTFSCLGPLLSFVQKKVPIHGIVLMYFQIICPGNPEYQEYKIHLYLLPSVPSLEHLDKNEIHFGYQRIAKPPYTNETVYTRTKYLITGHPTASVRPKSLKFHPSRHKDLHQFTEISIKGNNISIDLIVEEETTKDTVWDATLTKEEIKHLTESQATIQRGTSLEEHFVDRHRTALIERLSHIDPLLDDLLDQRLVTQEQYDTIRQKEPHQQKIRELYLYMKIWGKTDKDKLLFWMQKHNEPLIRDLMGL